MDSRQVHAVLQTQCCRRQSWYVSWWGEEKIGSNDSVFVHVEPYANFKQ